jgi:hypothetical protein
MSDEKWTKEKAFGILINESKSKKQAEYNLGRSQMGVIGYDKEEFHKKCCSKYTIDELEELSRDYEKANAKVMKEFEESKV